MSLPRRRFRDLTTAEVDAWVERDHERQLARYEREQERAAEEAMEEQRAQDRAAAESEEFYRRFKDEA